MLAARASELEREFALRRRAPALRGDRRRPAREPGGAGGRGRARRRPCFGALGTTPASASFAALHGLFWLASNLAAEQPLLLAVDDLHWCDRAVAALPGLPRPAARGAADPARRDASAAASRAPTRRCSRRSPATRRRRLARAAAAQRHRRRGARARAARRGAEPAFCEACHAATGGNPLLLRQLLRALEAERVEPVGGQRRRGRARGRPARRVEHRARCGSAGCRATPSRSPAPSACSASGAEVPAVAALAELEEQAAAAATGELARAEILRPDPPLGFVHPLVRDAVYRETPARRARAAPRARGGAAARRGRAGPSRSPRSCWRRRGAARPWVVDALEAAGATAMRRGAADSAVALLRRALEEPPAPERRAQVLLGLGTAEALTNGPAAADHLREAYGLLDDPVERGRVADGLVRVLIFTDRAPEAAALAREARAALPPGEDALAETLDALEIATYYIGGGITVDGLVRVARARRPGAPAEAARPRRDRLGLPRRRRGRVLRARGRGARARRADRARERGLRRLGDHHPGARRPRRGHHLARRLARVRASRRLALRRRLDAPLLRRHAALARRPRGRVRHARDGPGRVHELGLRRLRGRLPRRTPRAGRARARGPRDGAPGAGAQPRRAARHGRPAVLAGRRPAGAPGRGTPRGGDEHRGGARAAVRRVHEPRGRSLALVPGARARPPRPARRGARTRGPRARARADVGRTGRDRPRAPGARHAAQRPGRPRGGRPRARRQRGPPRPGQGALRARRAPCGATGGRPRPASRCGARWSSPRPATRRGSPSRCGPSSTRRARGAPLRRRGRCGGPDGVGAAGGGPGRGGIRPTGTSRRRSSSPRRPSRCTCPTRTGSWGSARAATSPRRSRGERQPARPGVPTASRYSSSKRAWSGVPRFHSSQNAVHRLVELGLAAVAARVGPSGDRRAVAGLEVLAVVARRARRR